MRTTKERMKSGEAFVGMKRRGSQLFYCLVSLLYRDKRRGGERESTF